MSSRPAQIGYRLSSNGDVHGAQAAIVGVDSLLEYEMDDGQEFAALEPGTTLYEFQLGYIQSVGEDLFPMQVSMYRLAQARIAESAWTESGLKRVRVEEV